MIFDSLDHIDVYKNTHPGLYRGLKLLTETDFSQLEDRWHEVDGKNLYFLLQTYETQPDNPSPETHDLYIDIQCLLSGIEVLGVGTREEMTGVAQVHPERDICLHYGPADTRIILTPGKFAALFPGDAHAPNIAYGAPTTCRKVVVKVKV